MNQNNNNTNTNNPLPGGIILDAIKDKNAIIMATNIRFIPGIAKGILQAAKDTDTPVMIEIARSECNLEGGYIGHTPKTFAENIINAAKETKNTKWALHADHIGIKYGTKEEIEETKKLIKAQIDAGFTSFAIDASHIFNFNGKTVIEELEGNIKATKEIADYIKNECDKYGLKNFGLEVEVGEIGRKDNNGFIVTSVTESVTYIKELNKLNVYPHTLAISNGSTHGNIYTNGNISNQISIDIPQTKKIAEALKSEGFNTRIAQHGITGTPLKFIKSLFPKGDILKGNVGTHWQNILFEILEKNETELYNKIHNWVLEKYADKEKTNEEIFGKNAKFALKEFFEELQNIDEKTINILEEKAYNDAVMFFKAFGCLGTGSYINTN
ncbi:class II fructose-bisphosphate aldolase [archaeon]|nr:class II fructose-bisphosphate aldolase [archaeon]